MNEHIELPALPKSLIDTIGEYGMARTDFAVGSPGHIDRWQAVLNGVKDFARSAIAAHEQARVVGEPSARELEFALRSNTLGNQLRHLRRVAERAMKAVPTSGWSDPNAPDALRSVLEAIASLPAPQAVQAGWKLVPVEPTDEMEAAAENDYEQRGETFPDWKSKWRAMLAAAPSPDGKAELAEAPIPESVLHAIREAGLTLLKTQRGYQLQNLGPAVAQ